MDQRGDRGELRTFAYDGSCPFGGSVAKRQAGRRIVWCSYRRRVLRRIDVSPGERCLKNRAGRTGRTIETTTLCLARHPMADAASPSVRSGRDFARGVLGVTRPCREFKTQFSVRRLWQGETPSSRSFL